MGTSEIVGPTCHIPQLAFSTLPNELLIHILTNFPTLSLLQLRLVSRHFQNIIIRIIHQRLLLAASLKDRKLLLECYHPSAQYTAPWVFCDYLGTPGLSNEEGHGSLYHDLDVERGQLKQLYSHFRPSVKDTSTQAVRPHPAGDVPGSRTHPDSLEPSSSNERKEQPDVVTHNVFLDAHELFTQLMINAALVQVGPRRGVFTSFIDIVDKKTPRIWRDWLVRKAQDERSENMPTMRNAVEGLDDLQSSSIVWADQGKTVGLRVKVTEKRWRRDVPIIMHKDEDQPISYSLELEDLLISTTHLLLAVEKSLLASHGNGKAMVFGAFASPAESSGPAI
ncbi:MAG: hypothetical protein Q9220_005915 [cf. Caloplaca sp. 1 TL-2023]